GGSSRTRRQQLREHVSYCLRVVLSSFANQSVRTLESPRSFHLHFPVIICTRSYNAPPPLSCCITQHVFDTGKNLPELEGHPYSASRSSLPCSPYCTNRPATIP